MITLDKNLSGESIVSTISLKAIGKLKFLYRHGHFLNVQLRQKLCNALIQCHLDYCCTSWCSSLLGKDKSKLQTIQNKIVRFILKLPSRAHIGQAQLNALNMLKVSDRVKQLRLNLKFFKIRNGLSPTYLTFNFRDVSSQHYLGTRNSMHNCFVPHVKGANKTTFYYNAIIDWNDLPSTIKVQNNYACFKYKSKQFLASRSMQTENCDFTYTT